MNEEWMKKTDAPIPEMSETNYRSTIYALRMDISKLHAEKEQLEKERNLYRKCFNHNINCEGYNFGDQVDGLKNHCDCGYAEALKELKALKSDKEGEDL